MNGDNIPSDAYSRIGDIFSGVSSDIINKMQVGYGDVFSTVGLSHPYTDYGFEETTITGTYDSPVITFTHTFTNNSLAERKVSEFGLFTSSGDLIYQKVFYDTEIPNMGIVPPGKSIVITASLTLSDSVIAFSSGTFSDATCAFNIYISPQSSGYIDISTFNTGNLVYYNGVELPNSNITKFTEARGAKSWTFRCYTEIYSQVLSILRYAGPISSDTSITGKQYVVSSYRSGVLAVFNTTTRLVDLNYNCYMQSPISPAPFGNGWFFDVNIIQSAYDEVIQ